MTPTPPPPTPPTDDLQRELEQVRAAQPQQPSALQPPVRKFLFRGALRLLALWAVLILLFLVIWILLNQK
jgi:hypothetical protein